MIKKSLFLAIFLLSCATPVYAQAITSTPTIEEQYITALTQILTLLQQQVAMLMQQLADVQKTQATQQEQANAISTQVTQIVQNTTPTTTPVFGSVQPVPTVPTITPTSMVVYVSSSTDTTTYPHGWYYLDVAVLDQNGNSMKNQMVHADVYNSDNLYKSISTESDRPTNGTMAINGKTEFVAGSFQDYPATPGLKTITFTSGNLSTTTIIQAQ